MALLTRTPASTAPPAATPRPLARHLAAESPRPRSKSTLSPFSHSESSAPRLRSSRPRVCVGGGTRHKTHQVRRSVTASCDSRWTTQWPVLPPCSPAGDSLGRCRWDGISRRGLRVAGRSRGRAREATMPCCLPGSVTTTQVTPMAQRGTPFEAVVESTSSRMLVQSWVSPAVQAQVVAVVVVVVAVAVAQVQVQRGAGAACNEPLKTGS